MFCALSSFGVYGMHAYPVSVEVDAARGLPAFDLVGLPGAAVKEARDRVRAAVKNTGFSFPVSRLTVNLAPADVRKAGSVYDLAIYLGVLCASQQLRADLSGSAFLGELSLKGDLRRVAGVLPMAIEAKRRGFARLFLPRENAWEAGVVEGIDILPAATAGEVVAHLTGTAPIAPFAGGRESVPEGEEMLPDLADVKGQYLARRALEVAACGGHNLLMVGPPGAGKSMLAKRLPSILPPMTFAEQLETTIVHSIAGLLPPDTALARRRPFRAPHHTISPVGLTGGGPTPRPGEISLAHNGVMFLDELAEFYRGALDALRQPLENGSVTITRAQHTLTFPCEIMLAAALNPCPCGYLHHPTRPCTCTAGQIARYRGRVSGPILDRIDLHLAVEPVEYSDLSSRERGESSAAVRARVAVGRQRQLERAERTGALCNARLSPAAVEAVCPLTPGAERLLREAFDTLGLSARARDKLLKLARTVADLDGCDQIAEAHMAEVIQYRQLDRQGGW